MRAAHFVTPSTDFLHANQLLHSLPISTLKDSRLGIDLNLYLQRLLNAPQTAEPYVTALGGSPLSLISHLENDLRALDKAKIKPVFILGGIETGSKYRPNQEGVDQRANERKLAWECYEQGDVDGLYDHLERSDSAQVSDVVRSVLRAFRHRNVEFLVAPYSAEGQLVSLERHSKSYVHAIYASTEALLFDRVDKVILSLNLRDLDESKNGAGAGTFTYVSKMEVLNALRCSEEEFLDLGILLGSETWPTFPPLTDRTIPNAAPRVLANGTNAVIPVTPNPLQALDVVRQHRSGYTACMAFAEHKVCSSLNYVEIFCKVRCLFKFSLVTSAEEGRVLPLPLATPPPPQQGSLPNGIAPGVNGTTPPSIPSAHGAPILGANEVPSDLHDIFTNRLPDELFLHLSRGLLSSTVIDNLASGLVKEAAPLGDADTEEWRTFVRSTLIENPQSPRCVALALLASSLNTFWSSRKVFVHYHFDPNGSRNVVPHDSPSTQALITRVNTWNVHSLFIEEELRRQMSSTIDIALCLGATGRSDLAAKTKTPVPNQSNPSREGDEKTPSKDVIEKKDELVANIIWRFLELRGFLNHNHLHTPYARALHLSIQSARLNDKFQEPLYIALEMLRAGVLHSNPFGQEIRSGGPSWGDEEDESQRDTVRTSRKHLLLIMRVFSLVPMTYKSLPWRAPLSRELIQFNDFASALSRNLRILLEVIASSLLLRGGSYVKRNRDDYLDISLSLPFLSQASTGLGIVIKCYLEALLTFNNGAVQKGNEDDADVVEAREAVLGMLEGTFSNVRNVRNEVSRGFRFWSAVVQAVLLLEKEKAITSELAAQFREADDWLQPMSKM